MSKNAKIVLWLVLATLPVDIAIVWFLMRGASGSPGGPDAGWGAPAQAPAPK
jgi:hypothetical protein